MHRNGPALLACCHACQMIGSEAEATAHRLATGHEVEVLDAETSVAVRAEHDRQRAERVAGFLSLACLHAPPRQEGPDA